MSECICCESPRADYVAIQCVGPFNESGCGECLWVCADCAAVIDQDPKGSVAEKLSIAESVFFDEHEPHNPSWQTPTERTIQ